MFKIELLVFTRAISRYQIPCLRVDDKCGDNAVAMALENAELEFMALATVRLNTCSTVYSFKICPLEHRVLHNRQRV